MSETSFCELKSIVSHLPKSKILAGDAVNNGRYKFYLSGKKVARSDVAIVDQDAVVMGDGGVASITFATGKYSYSSHNFGFYSNSDDFLSEYIFRALEQFLPEIDYKGFVGSGIKNIDKNFLFDLHVEKISLAKQKKIASILTSVDEVIENTQKQIDKLQDLKKATMKELLTKGIGHTEFKDSELGRIPKSWEICLLDDVTIRGSGHTPSKQHADYWNGGIQWVSLADSFRLDDGFICETENEISESGLKNSSAVLHPAGTVILSRDAGIGKSAILKSEMAVSQHFMAWRCSQKMDSWYLYYLLQHMKPTFENIAIGSTIKTIGLGFFKTLKIAYPDIEEQKQISQKLRSLDEVIDGLKQKLCQIKSLKKSLMQDLLTGNVRVQVN